MEINESLKKRFCKDFRIPINIFDEPYFTYFKELYEPVFKIEEKFGWLEKAIDFAGGSEEFFALGSNVGKNIKERIITSTAYQNFNNADMNKDFPLIEQVKKQNIYIIPNVGKELISIDLNKANFNSLGLFGLKDELKAYSYDDLIKQETDLEYYLNSKMIRQVIFGDLNPNRQQRVQRYIINQLCEVLTKEGCELTSASSDEIVISNKTEVKEIEQMLAEVKEEFKFFRVEKFRFDSIDKDYFIKHTYTDKEDKLEFKNVPSHFFAQVYKKHFSIESHEYDRLFYHEGFLSEFKEPLFQNDLKKKLKI